MKTSFHILASTYLFLLFSGSIWAQVQQPPTPTIRDYVYDWAHNNGDSRLNLAMNEALVIADYLAEQDEANLPKYYEIFNFTSGTNPQSLRLRSLSQIKKIIEELKDYKTPSELDKYRTILNERAILLNWIKINGIAKYSQNQSLDLAEELLKFPPEKMSAIQNLFIQKLSEQSVASIHGLTQALVKNDQKNIQIFTNYNQWIAGSNGLAACEVRNAIDSNFRSMTSIDNCLSLPQTEYKRNSQEECWEVATHIAPIRQVDSILCDNPIAKEIRNAVHSFDRPLHLYHYVDSGRMYIGQQEKIDLQDSRIKNHHIEWTQYFWNTARQNQSQNSGLYTAIDPAIARMSYGTGRPLLYRIEVEVGHKYLHYNEIANAISQRSQDYLEKRKCRITGLSYLFNRNQALNIECLKVLYEVVRELNIVAMSYNWGSNEIPGCLGRDMRAFIIYSPSILSSKYVRIFNSEELPTDPKDLEEVQNIQRLLRETKVDPFWSYTLSIKNVSDQSHLEWKKKYLFNCKETN